MKEIKLATITDNEWFKTEIFKIENDIYKVTSLIKGINEEKTIVLTGNEFKKIYKIIKELKE